MTPDPTIPMKPHDLACLTDLYFDGELPDRQQQLLRDELLAHEGSRDLFVELTRQAGAMTVALGALSLDLPAAETPRPAIRPAARQIPRHRRPKQARIPWVAAAVAAMLVVGVVWFINARVSAKPHLGVLVEQVGATWAAGSPAMNDGDKLYGQRLELLDGLVKIRMKGGAELIVEAPAEFILQTGSALYLHHGNLVATCRDRAKGFTVNTNSITVVDIGTEFGIQTDSKTNTVAVFQGAVELHQPEEKKRASAKPVQVAAGQLATIDSKGNSTQRAMQMQDQGEFARTVPVSAYAKAISACRPLYQIKRTLTFDGPNSVVELNRGFEFLARSKDYSIALWIRPAALEAQNILAGTNHEGANTRFGSQIRINAKGQLEHYTYCPPNILGNPKRGVGWGYTQASSEALTVGEWIFVVATARSGGQMHLYVNGQSVATPQTVAYRIESRYPRLVLGGEAGKDKGRSRYAKPYRGRLRNVALFGRALTAGEIISLYQASKN